MATKLEVLELRLRDEGCIAKSARDEPLFTLCARDALAPALVDLWADMLEMAHRENNRRSTSTGHRITVSPQVESKLDDARRCAAAMREWQIANQAKTGLPD